MKKHKLELKKRTIASLSDAESRNVMGGEAATTSFSRCTNFVCCGDGCTTTTQNITGPSVCGGDSCGPICIP